MENLEKTLKSGKVVTFDNDNFCLLNESNDFRQASKLSYAKDKLNDFINFLNENEL